MTGYSAHPERYPNCELCGNEGQVLYKDVSDHLFGMPGCWDFRACPNPECRMIWLDPRPTCEQTARAYEQYYTHDVGNGMGRLARIYGLLRDSVVSRTLGYDFTRGLGFRLVGMVLSRVRDLRDRFEGDLMWLHASQRGHLLDVGCGSGEFLVLMRDHGWQVTGIEPDAKAVRRAIESYGLEVYVGSLPHDALGREEFAAITMNHVMEHLPDPALVLRECRRLLQPGGWLVIVTPNTDSLGHARYATYWRGLEPPRHVRLYSAKLVGQLVEQAGFVVRQVRTTARGAMYILGLSDGMFRAARAGRTESFQQLLRGAKRRVHRLAALQLASSLALCRDPNRGEEAIVIAEKTGR